MKRILISTLALILAFAANAQPQQGGQAPQNRPQRQRPTPEQLKEMAEKYFETVPKPDLTYKVWAETGPNGSTIIVPPTLNGLTGPEISYGTHVSNVTEPELYIFLPEKCNGKAILMCAGGGYQDVWYGTEGFVNARWYTDQGYVYACLKYRLPNGHKEVPLDDVQEAMRMLRTRADEFGFEKLGIAGCSAGGHLAGMASTHWTNEINRPDFTILFYPVVTLDPSFTHGGSGRNLLGPNASQEDIDAFSNEKAVNEQTPPAFIMGNSDDNVVPVRNSIEYYNALHAHGVSATLHIYPVGGHGWCDNKNFVFREQWMSDLAQWLKLQ